jgi:hypothetical protein
MNRMAASALALASVFAQVQRLNGAAQKIINPPAAYRWSETSAFVRVPKSFLGEVNLFSVTITNFETMDYVLTEDFIQTFALTGAEVDRLTEAITAGVQEWRVEKAKHLISTHDPVDTSGTHKKILEKFTFLVEPAIEQKSLVLNKLKEQVLQILGQERSEWFWQYGGMLDSNDVQGFGPKSPPPDGMTTKTYYTFALQEGEDGPEISLYNTEVSSGLGHNGAGMSAGPYPATFDRYAPDAMKPVLARWRKDVAEHAAQTTDAKINGKESGKPSEVHALRSKTASSPGEDASSAQNRTWQDGSPYLDVPKKLIKSLQIAGLTVDDEVSPDAQALFGLTDSQANAVTTLYAEMRRRFEQIEVSHLERTKATEYHFVLRAFPDQAKALQTEWLQQLGQTVGTNRAELLDVTMRTPIRPDFRKQIQNPDTFRRMREKGPSWLTRGMVETEIDLTVDKGADGQPVIKRLEYRSGGEGGERGSIGIAQGAHGMKGMPERWRHLITPDMLTIPLVF